ncbi:MAG: hypothetical protein GY708_17840, partial [Actinomycetia bacterium]|nr:hypothetical protein [Actinomycetes bacterium]
MAVAHDGDPTWTDYTVSLTAEFVPGTPWEHFNILLRSDGFLRTSGGSAGTAYQLDIVGVAGWPHTSPQIALTRSDGDTGINVTIFHEDWPLPAGPVDLLISLSGGRIQLWINALPVFDLVDPDPLPYGGIGVHAIWEAEARFDNVVVTQAGPELSIASEIPAAENEPVDVDVVFTANGSAVAATTFSIDYDEDCLFFDPIDFDPVDGIFDNVAVHV